MLSINNVSKIAGGETLYSEASFQINPGEKVGLVGPNGAGKTTFFRMIVGEEKPDTGSISFPDRFKIAYFSQNVGEMKGRTALEEVISASSQVNLLQTEIRKIETELENPDIDPDHMNDILIKLGDYQTEFEKLGGYDLETRAQEILTGLGILPADHSKKTEEFSGGWKMRIALAKVLAQKPDLILMDEPTNYLDMETILWLEEWLKTFEGAIFMTSHDREFMTKIAKKIIEVANNTVTTYSGNFDFYVKERDIRRKNLQAQFERQQDQLAKEEEFIARFAARASHAAQVQSRVKKLEKIDRVEIPQEELEINFEFPKPPRGSNDVVIMKGLSKTWKRPNGEDHVVFENLTGTIERLEKLAVVGVNGAGKSTLLKTIVGMTDATRGEVSLGPSIKVGYFGQFTLEQLNPENTVFEEVRHSLHSPNDSYLRNLLASFLFRGDEVHKKVKFLSGGEKARLILATLLSNANNLLVLDEPTNHLDIRSRELLLEALKQYEGTVILVSHDRYFLKELATKVFEVDKGGINIYPGNYQYYLEKTGHK